MRRFSLLNLYWKFDKTWIKLEKVLKVEEGSAFLDALAATCRTNFIFVEPFNEMFLSNELFEIDFLVRLNKTYSVTSMTAAQASVSGTSNGKLAQWTMEKIFFTVQARRSTCCLSAALTLGHELNSIANRRWGNWKIFQHLSSLWQKTVAVKNVSVRFLQAVVKVSTCVTEQASIDFVDSVIVQGIAPRVTSCLSFQVLRQQPRVVLHRRLWIRVDCCHCVVWRHALLLKCQKLILIKR